MRSLFLLFSFTLTSSLFAVEAKVPMTDEEFKQAQAERANLKSKIKVDVAPPIKRQLPTLMGGSTILSSGNKWTIVPKGSIIHIPEFLKDKLSKDRKGDYMPWPVFYRMNFSWIETREVSEKIARGEERMDEEEIKAFSESPKIIVACLNKGPISYIEMPKPEPKINPIVK